MLDVSGTGQKSGLILAHCSNAILKDIYCSDCDTNVQL